MIYPVIFKISLPGNLVLNFKAVCYEINIFAGCFK